METGNRMDGLSTNLGKALLKLIGMILEGKMRRQYMLELQSLLGNITKKAKFFHYVDSKHPELAREYDILLKLLCSEMVHVDEKLIPHHVVNSIYDMKMLHKWEDIHVHTIGGLRASECNTPKLPKGSALLVVENYQYQWIKDGMTLNETLSFYNFPPSVKIKHIIRLDYNEKDKVLDLTFFKIDN